MSENRDNGGPAFPFVDSASPHEHQGMSLRDYFAATRLRKPSKQKQNCVRWSLKPFAQRGASMSDWINPNDKTQKQFLPWIGEPVLFCHQGKTYRGIHTGGSFRTGKGKSEKHFNTWACHWKYPPAAYQTPTGATHE